MPETQHPPRETPVSGQDYLAVQASPEFQELRSRLRRFVFPMSGLFLIWYFAYVLLGAFAHDFMAIKVWGNINVGLLIGLGQFVSTFVITGIYVWFANRELDPRAEDYEASVDALIEGVDAVALVPPLVQVFQELAERVDPETTQKALSRLRRLSLELDG